MKEWTDKLKNETDPTERGHALAFVTHLIGDINQPLHCAALIGEYFPIDEFPDGDQGGNLLWWGSTMRFHSMWEGLVCPTAADFDGAYAELRSGLECDKYTDRLDRKTFEEWAVESYGVARQAYANFLEGSEYVGRSTRSDEDGNEQDGQLFESPTKEYRKWAKATAFEQGRVAAFRLADALAAAFG